MILVPFIVLCLFEVCGCLSQFKPGGNSWRTEDKDHFERTKQTSQKTLTLKLMYVDGAFSFLLFVII